MIEALLASGSVSARIRSYQQVLSTRVDANGSGVHQMPIAPVDSSRSVLVGIATSNTTSITSARSPAIRALRDTYVEYEIFTGSGVQYVEFAVLELAGVNEVRQRYIPFSENPQGNFLGPLPDPAKAIGILAECGVRTGITSVIGRLSGKSATGFTINRGTQSDNTQPCLFLQAIIFK